jgi:hypothetical protein
MFMKIFSGVIIICFIAGSALATTYIEYTLDGDWIYEEDYPGTLSLSENPSGGITAAINVPTGIDGGGLSASRHDLAGFSLDNNIFIELDYGTLTSTIIGPGASLSLVSEMEFFDSDSTRYTLSMAIRQSNESRYFVTCLTEEPNPDNCEEVPILGGLSIDEGALGFNFHGNNVSAYFKDADNNLLYPFLDWDISQIVGTYGFSVDNDFEAVTVDGGTVVASVNLKHVAYGPSWPQVYIRIFDNPSDLELLREYRDRILSKKARGRRYKKLLYKNSEEALAVLLNNPELIDQAKDLIYANIFAVEDVLHGHEGIIYNTEEIAAFLNAYAKKAPPKLKILAKVVKRQILKRQRKNKLFFGFRLK